MIDAHRRALSAVRFDWAPQPDDVWSRPRFHVDGLHRNVLDDVLGSLGVARESRNTSPVGLAIIGRHGIGKTHLLSMVREQVQAEDGYFFLISLGDGERFWESAALSVLNGLLRPAADDVTWSGRMSGGLEPLSSLGGRLRRAGIAVAEVRVREPGLRGVFFRVTGREFES